MRKAITVLMIVALACVLSVRPAAAGNPPAGIRYAPPTITFKTDTASYQPGGTVTWHYRLYNGNDQPLELTFPSSQVYDLILWQGGTEVARWSEGRMFLQIIVQRTVRQGETMELTDAWSLPADLKTGDYTLEFVLTADSGEQTGAKKTIGIGKEPTPLLSVRFTSDKLIYRVGSLLTLRYTVSNVTAEDIVLTFPSAQQFDWTISDARGNLIYQWMSDKRFAGVVTRETVPAGGSLTFESQWTLPRNLRADGYRIAFTVLADMLDEVTTLTRAVLIGGKPLN
jgi:hypothetical protein